MSWGEPGTDPGQFNLPHNVATDGDGLVYVADRENHRVQIFDGEGRYQGEWHSLHRPCGLYADKRDQDHFYIGELGSGMPVTDNTPNIGPRVTVVTRKGERVCRFGALGEKPGEFTAPHTVVTDSRGDCYVGEVSWTARRVEARAAARAALVPEVPPRLSRRSCGYRGSSITLTRDLSVRRASNTAGNASRPTVSLRSGEPSMRPRASMSIVKANSRLL